MDPAAVQQLLERQQQTHEAESGVNPNQPNLDVQSGEQQQEKQEKQENEQKV